MFNLYFKNLIKIISIINPYQKHNAYQNKINTNMHQYKWIVIFRVFCNKKLDPKISKLASANKCNINIVNS